MAKVSIENSLVFNIKFDFYGFGEIYRNCYVKNGSAWWKKNDSFAGVLELKFPHFGKNVKIVFDNFMKEIYLGEIIFDNRSAMMVFKNWYSHVDEDEFWKIVLDAFKRDLEYYLVEGDDK